MIKKIAPRNYYCPTCGHTQTVSTNHTGEVYPGCKNCSNTVLYHESFIAPHDLIFELRPYCMGLSTIPDTGECETPARWGFTCHKTLSSTPGRVDRFDELAKLAGRPIRAQAPFYDNPDQLVTDAGRLYVWEQAIYPNTLITQGYYLAPLGGTDLENWLDSLARTGLGQPTKIDSIGQA